MNQTTPPEAASDELDPTIVALGGEEITVVYKDGKSESVKVRILEIDQFGRYITLVLKERACAEFICAKPAGWAATLSTLSLIDINEKAEALNLELAQRSTDRRAKIIGKLTAQLERNGVKSPLPPPSSPSVNSARASV